MTLLLILALGLVNWFGTLLIVESEFFRPVREWFVKRELLAQRRMTIWFWGKVRFLVTCHMCTGTWVGLALVPWAPMLFGPGLFAYIITGLLIKGIGHGILVLHKLGEEATKEHKMAALQLQVGTIQEEPDAVWNGSGSVFREVR